MLLQFGGGTAGGTAGGGGLSPATATQALEASDRNALSHVLEFLKDPDSSGVGYGAAGPRGEAPGYGTASAADRATLGNISSAAKALGLIGGLAGVAPLSAVGGIAMPIGLALALDRLLSFLGVPGFRANPYAGILTAEDLQQIKDYAPQFYSEVVEQQAAQEKDVEAAIASLYGGGAFSDIGPAAVDAAATYGGGEFSDIGPSDMGGGLGDTGGLGGSDMGSSADSGIGGGGLY